MGGSRGCEGGVPLDAPGSGLSKISSLPAWLAKIILQNELSLGRKKSFDASDDIENEEVS